MTGLAAVRHPSTLRRARQRSLPYLFFMPAFVLVAVISFLPLFYAIFQSFFKSDYLNLGAFVGLANYADFIFTERGLKSLLKSAYFVGGTVLISVPLGFLLALLLNEQIPFRGFFRTALIAPWLVSHVVSGFLWIWLLNSEFGPIAHLMHLLGFDFPSLLTDVTLAMPAVIIASAWSAYPLVMIFVLAALQTIPSELIDASRMDGTTPWERFWYVTFPMIRGTTLVALVLTTLHAFNNVTLLFIMTGGGPVGETETAVLRVFLEGFEYFRMGIASAGAVVVFLLNMAFTLMYIRALRTDQIQTS